MAEGQMDMCLAGCGDLSRGQPQQFPLSQAYPYLTLEGEVIFHSLLSCLLRDRGGGEATWREDVGENLET